LTATASEHVADEHTTDRSQKILRRIKIGILVVACVMTFQSLLLIAGAWRNDRKIEANMGVAQAQVLSAGPRRSTIEFVGPNRVTYRPKLGVLYPSELAAGMRIYVEYDKTDPELVRVQHRTAALSIIPAASVAVAAWLVAGALLFIIRAIQRRDTDAGPPGSPAEPE
jgi:hypothetical protein